MAGSRLPSTDFAHVAMTSDSPGRAALEELSTFTDPGQVSFRAIWSICAMPGPRGTAARRILARWALEVPHDVVMRAVLEEPLLLEESGDRGLQPTIAEALHAALSAEWLTEDMPLHVDLIGTIWEKFPLSMPTVALLKLACRGRSHN